MSRETTPLTEQLYEYYREVAVRESDIHRRLREETGKLENARMQISAEQGHFMTVFVAAMQAKKALEVGTFTGYSALCIAQGLVEGGSLLCLDIDDEWPTFGRRYWAEAGVADRIEFRSGPASDTMRDLIAAGEEGEYDFIFIDADKKGIEDYYEKSLRLLRRGGVVAVDNTLWSGRVADPENREEDTKAIRGFNASVIDDRRVRLSLVPIGDGVTLLYKL
ncbi:MAG: class I SAM-dependent methyltransferase [Gemmatimonadota bacterium]